MSKEPVGAGRGVVGAVDRAAGSACERGVDVAHVRALDRRAFQLARVEGVARLRVGQALAKLGDGHEELGIGDFGAYVRERVGRSRS